MPFSFVLIWKYYYSNLSNIVFYVRKIKRWGLSRMVHMGEGLLEEESSERDRIIG